MPDEVQPTVEELAAQLKAAQDALEKEKERRRSDAIDKMLARADKEGEGGGNSSGGAKIGLGDDDDEGDLASGFGLVQFGHGDVPVSDDIMRALSNLLLPPLSCFEEQNLHYIALHHVSFLPPVPNLTSKDKRSAIDGWKRIFECDHMMPPLKFFAALMKMSLAVRTVICEDDDSKTMVLNDVATFTMQLVERSSLDGSWRIIREYALHKIEAWRTGIAARRGWKVNRLSDWSEDLYKRALTTAGGKPDANIAFRSELEGKTKTAWGEIVNLMHGTSATQKERVTTIRLQDHELGREVLDLKAPGGELPEALGFNYPWAVRASQAGPTRAQSTGAQRQAPYSKDRQSTGNDRSSSAGRDDGKDRRRDKKQVGGKDKENVAPGDAGSQFACLTCGSKAHNFRNCTNVHSSLKVVGDEIKQSYDDGSRAELCKNFNRERCSYDDKSCRYSHGCTRCGERGCAAYKCSSAA